MNYITGRLLTNYWAEGMSHWPPETLDDLPEVIRRGETHIHRLRTGVDNPAMSIVVHPRDDGSVFVEFHSPMD